MPVLSHSYAHFQPVTDLGPAVITGLAGSGAAGYFADQYGQPRLVLGDEAWGLPGGAGRWNGGDWAADYDTYLEARAAQGFNAVYTHPYGNTVTGGPYDDGRTWDGVAPFTGGDQAVFNDTFWARIDYLVDQAKAAGITIFLNPAYSYDIGSGKALPDTMTNAKWQAYGAALAARYASRPNIVWVLADDYFGSWDTQFTYLRTGLRGGGDSHALSVQNMSESTSRKQRDGTACAWGASYAEFNAVYIYDVAYLGVEAAYLEPSPIPVLWLDGWFDPEDSGNSYWAAYDRALRQDAWWAISSGSRGKITGSEGVWQWPSGAQAAVTGNWWYVNNAGHIRSAVEALPGWHQLIPDTSSLLVTAGRGTRATWAGTPYESAFTDVYVTASRTADGTLALIYLSHATTITIDESKMTAGYAAQRIDPVSGAATTVSSGSSYNSGSWGNNSAGDPDWALALKAP